MMKKSKRIEGRWSSAYMRYLSVAAVLLAVAAPAWSPASATSAGEAKSTGGLTVYLGVVPAEIVKDPSPGSAEWSLHGGTPHGRHEHHIVVTIYDSATNARISDATVAAKVSGLGLSGPQKTLKPMNIADTVTYGAFFNLTADLYTITVTVRRPGSQPVVLDFKYDHRRN
jgi:hypothetical protein